MLTESRAVLAIACASCAVFFLTAVSLNFRIHAAHQLPAYDTNLDAHLSSKDQHLLADPFERNDGLENWNSDFDRYGFSETQCSSEFGDLFQDIERAITHTTTSGKATESDINLDWKEDGAVRAMIYRQKLYVLESNTESDYMISRALSTLQQINRAITTSPEPLPNIEFSFLVSDIPDAEHQHHTSWALSRQEDDKNLWLMPDFGYWSWPVQLIGNYEQVRAEMRANEAPWKQKIPKALWRGVVKTNKVRNALIDVSKGRSWADIREVKWANRTSLAAGFAESALSMQDHCNHQFLIHTEGRSHSGRGKYLLNCQSVTIMHKSEWIEPHHSVLVPSGPEQNFVQVERDFSDLEAKIQQLLHDPTFAEAIARNSVKTFRDRHLTPAAQACYWRHLIRSWAKVSFRPKPWMVANGTKRIRGVPFETYILQTSIQNDDHCSIWRSILRRC